MKAGKTPLKVGTRVRITKIASNDPEDQQLVGLTGEITHPFPGLMIGSASKYICGIWLDPGQIIANELNLTRGDEIKALEEA